MDFVTYFVLLGAYGAREAWTLHCYNCLSGLTLDEYDANCTALRGKGERNVNQYFTKCATLKNACSIYIGHFKGEKEKPPVVVWRKCDFMWKEDEPECRNGSGPTGGGGTAQSTGLTCKCTTDFCNWRKDEDVDIKVEVVTRASTPLRETTTQKVSRGSIPFSSPTLFCVLSTALIRLLIR